MRKLAKSLGALFVTFCLISCENTNVHDFGNTPTAKDFNSDNYNLKIKSKYQNVGGKLDLSENKKQHIRAARKITFDNGVVETSENSIALSIDDEGVQTLMQLDPDLDVNSPGQAARILLAPEKSTLVEVVGTEKEASTNNEEGGAETEDNSVVAPSRFQMVEYDASGTYGIDIGSEIYQKLDLSAYANGKIQPRSIKTKDFTFSDSTLNFEAARSDIYFIKDGEYDGMSAENPKDLWIPYYDLSKPERCRSDLHSAIWEIVFGYNCGQILNQLYLDFETFEFTKGIHKTHVTIRSNYSRSFTYDVDLFMNVKYGSFYEPSTSFDYPEVYQKNGATKYFHNDNKFQSSSNGDYYTCINAECDALDKNSMEECLDSFKDNFDVYMVSDLKKQNNMINCVELMQYKDLPINMKVDDWKNTFVIKIKNYYYITTQEITF